MSHFIRITLLLILLLMPSVALAAEELKFSKRFLSLQPIAVSGSSTWAIHYVDGANRRVAPYLSSLARGEAATGTVTSAPFAISSELITFTICGHDGQGGGRRANFVALVDEKSGKTLRKTVAPGTDGMQEQSWEVADLQGQSVRIEIHDELAEAAFAWMGVGRITAAGAFEIDFQYGLPEDWQATIQQSNLRTDLMSEGVPFRQLQSVYSMIPSEGVAEIPCNFSAQRIFFLGCTVAEGRPLDVCGWVEIVYEQGVVERIPLMIGYTLDRQCKLLSQSPALHIHSSGDPFQHYLVIRPKQEKISVIRLSRNVGALPRITAITCEPLDFKAEVSNQHLLPLPEESLSDSEEGWISSHELTADMRGWHDIEADIRRANKIQAVTFQRIKISDEPFEAGSICDVNNDGIQDIVSGGYWYEGPDYSHSHKMREVKEVSEYRDDFSDYPLDVNGDGFLDIVTGAYFGNPLQWLENPKNSSKLWPVHDIEQVGPIETVRCWDVDGDGVVEVVPNAGGNVIFFRLVLDQEGKGTGKFTKHVVKQGGCGHGLGFGDINGDGRGDFVVSDGWLEAPDEPLKGKWVWHDNQFRLGAASVPIVVHDVNGDGQADLIVGQAHDYGLDWYEQTIDESSKRSWTRHPIDRYCSQYHDMQLADLDNDGKPELITGKRYRGHNGHDPGSTDPLFLRYYKIDERGFTAHTIDYGPQQLASGAGIYSYVKDIDQDGWKDILAPGKEGLYLFKNRSIQELD